LKLKILFYLVWILEDTGFGLDPGRYRFGLDPGRFRFGLDSVRYRVWFGSWRIQGHPYRIKL